MKTSEFDKLGKDLQIMHAYPYDFNIDDDLKCQKQLTFPAHSAPDVVDEHRRLCKLWLLLERGVPEDASNGRERHLKDIGGRGFRRNAPDVSESMLDETVLIPGALLE